MSFFLISISFKFSSNPNFPQIASLSSLSLNFSLRNPFFFVFANMRKLCPNYNLEDGLETVLEVPMPEELFAASKTKPGWNQMKSYWSKPTATATGTATATNMTRLFGGRNAEIQLLLGVVGAPLIPLPVQPDHHNDYENPIHKDIKDQPLVITSSFFFYHPTSTKISS
jgi:hypothetical protein